MQERIKANKKIDVIMNAVVEEVLGDENIVTGVRIKDDKGVREIKTDAMFLAIGHIPNTKFLGDMVKTDKIGFIIADKTKTNVEGLFAAGDVQDPVYKQAITAAGSGCEAALEAEKYLNK